MSDLPDETIESHVAALLVGLEEARAAGSLHLALRTLRGWECRLLLRVLLGAPEMPTVGSPEDRAAKLLAIDGEVALLAGTVAVEIHLPSDVIEALERLAEINERAPALEIYEAIRRHLEP
jgi:hypothetical protein